MLSSNSMMKPKPFPKEIAEPYLQTSVPKTDPNLLHMHPDEHQYQLNTLHQNPDQTPMSNRIYPHSDNLSRIELQPLRP